VLRPVGAIALLALVLFWVGPRNLWAQLAAIGQGWFVLAIAVAIAANAVSAWRWAFLARALGLQASFRPLASAYAQGITLNVLLPGATLGGDALRALRLARLGNPLGVSTLSVLLDRASGLWVLCLLSLIAAAAWLIVAPESMLGQVEARWLWLYLAMLLVAATVPWWPLRVRGTFTGWRARVAQHLREWGTLLATRRPALVRSLAPSLLVQVLSGTTLWLCAEAAGSSVNYVGVLTVAAPIFIAAAIPISLGGFGPREFAATLAFALIGAPPAVGASAAVLYGLTAVVQGVLAAPLLILGARTEK
jgi:uncharacterized protein (TIRG00374 family)